MRKKLLKLIREKKIDITELGSIDKNNFENFFNIVYKGDKSYFNLCKGLSFENIDGITDNGITDYVILEGDSPTLVSYKFYKTIKLWWLICIFNGIKNPFKEFVPGKSLKIPSDGIKDIILSIISNA